jgi:hypothetical protein
MQNPIARFVPQLGGEYPKSFLDLYNRIPAPNGNSEPSMKSLVWKAYEFSSHYHEGQKRKFVMKDKNGSQGNRILNIALR